MRWRYNQVESLLMMAVNGLVGGQASRNGHAPGGVLRQLGVEIEQIFPERQGENMKNIRESSDLSKYGYEARIFSADGKYEKTFTDKAFLEKVNQCEHLFALSNITKDAIEEVEKLLSPLKPRAASLYIESKGGSVVSKMTLEDFFRLLEIGKRIEISDRFQKENPLANDVSNSIDREIQAFLNELGDE